MKDEFSNINISNILLHCCILGGQTLCFRWFCADRSVSLLTHYVSDWAPKAGDQRYWCLKILGKRMEERAVATDELRDIHHSSSHTLIKQAEMSQWLCSVITATVLITSRGQRENPIVPSRFPLCSPSLYRRSQTLSHSPPIQSCCVLLPFNYLSLSIEMLPAHVL